MRKGLVLLALAAAGRAGAGVSIVYCGYVGGTGSSSVAVDAAGSAYLVGSVDTSFPAVVGPDLSYNGGSSDATVAKVRPDGTGLVYAGYLGGLLADYGLGVAVDAAGAARVSGFTASDGPDFPVVVGPDLTFDGGNGDNFVAEVKADGTGLVYCGYVGGSNLEGRSRVELALDPVGDAYLVSDTTSTEATFPVAVGPDLTYNSGLSGLSDAYLAKIKADGSGLDYCGYIGGSDVDVAADVAVDGSGSAYVTGVTKSTETSFPVTVGPILVDSGGDQSFAAKVSADGRSLAYAGYLGPNGGFPAIGVAPSLGALLAGATGSHQSSFPVVVGPDLTYNGDIEDAFVARIKPDGSGLDYCGYIGGNRADRGTGIASTSSGTAFVAGTTSSTQATFPATSGDRSYNSGKEDGFIAEVRADGRALLFGTYLGGSGDDYITDLAIDVAGRIYVVGATTSGPSTFPVEVGPSLVLGGAGDGFVAALDEIPCPGAAAEVSGLLAVKEWWSPDDVDFVWQSDRAANGYDLWYVTDRTQIDLARQTSSPPAVGVIGCGSPVPAPSESCTDFGAVPRGSPAIFFYQVRVSCDAASEGP